MEQFAWMDAMSEVTVVLSATMWNVEMGLVVLVVLEEKVACVMGPPGRVVLLGSPYCEKEEERGAERKRQK